MLKQTEFRNVSHALTESEKKEYSADLVKALDTVDKLSDEAEKVKKTYKDKIDTHGGIARQLLSSLSAGREFRDMECPIVYDWKAGTRMILHPETGEIIEKRGVTNEERQMNLDEVAPPAPKKSAKKKEETAA